MNGIVNLLDSILNVNKPEIISEEKMIIRKRNLTIEFYIDDETDIEVYFIHSNQLVTTLPTYIGSSSEPDLFYKIKTIFLEEYKNKKEQDIICFLSEFIS